ncbi:MAG: hypothetical protein RLZZ584_3558 [Pseudomonadota bacterium]
MRRADRLFQLIQLIRGLSTAAWLAGRLEVSLRTVYRDVAELQAQGVPIEGEAGVGYPLGAGYDLPPLMFSHDEAKALVAAVRMAQPHLDPALAAQAESALSRILAVLPPAARAAAESLALYVLPVRPDDATRRRLEVLRVATETHHKLELVYLDLQQRSSERAVHPLGCFVWGQVWTLAAWCETREAFRSFRVDRIWQVELVDERFRDEPGRTLADLLREVQAKG